ncbi:hypothetical protein ACFCWG_24985 [Streptomyces sp. NPDC056390]|uniref:hypothetical protein n=1 Tax=Streptomyces sp. NPDC056390 TaxID=3345806 RepID=UPI0035D9B14E
MAYTEDELRELSRRAGVPQEYLQRLMSAEDHDPQDPEGNNILTKKLTIVFDHHVAKCLASPDPIAALRQFGFEETADAFGKR